MKLGIHAMIIGIVVLLLSGCGTTLTPKTDSEPMASKEISASPSATPDAQSTIQTIEEAAEETMDILHRKDIDKLAEIIHPTKGIQLSPYGTININKDVKINANEIVALSKDPKIINWGNYDGSGFPIELEFSEYYDEFIYNHDFINAPKTSINEPISKGNSLNNIFEIYPKDQYQTIEYHFDVINPENSGLDWNSLKLVFEHVDHQWKLVAMIHDQWTI